MQAIDQLVVEMTYMTKMKNQTFNRRISLSFRDAALFNIFKVNLETIKSLTGTLSQSQGSSDVLLH
jgi:hypothetical protein